jgi:hypothetical protein
MEQAVGDPVAGVVQLERGITPQFPGFAGAIN